MGHDSITRSTRIRGRVGDSSHDFGEREGEFSMIVGEDVELMGL
jgi:hypothetical protein